MTTETYRVGPAPRLDVRIERGRIHVLPGEPGELRVQLGGPGAADVRIDATHAGVTVRTGSRILRASAHVDVHVTVPADTRTSLALATGGIDARAPLAELQASAASGNLDAATVTDRTTLKAASGDVRVDELRGHASVTSGSGDITVGRLTGTARLTTASGDIDVGVVAGDLACKTASGDITVHRMDEGLLEFRTASGDTSVGIAPGRRVRYDVKAVTGRLRLPDPSPAAGRAGEPGSAVPRPLVRIEGRSVSGDTTLRHAPPDA